MDMVMQRSVVEETAVTLMRLVTMKREGMRKKGQRMGVARSRSSGRGLDRGGGGGMPKNTALRRTLTSVLLSFTSLVT